MADDNRLRRFAVLIDADNTSPRIAAGLFEEIAKFGEASVRRIYGDFSSTRLKSWAEILQKYAIDPYQQFAYTSGKNASDIALVIDAMDLLHSRRFDGFCLVSSDSDFTRLASRLREEGADVYGFGAQKTPESFRQACRRFIYTENLRARGRGADARRGNGAEVPAARQRRRSVPDEGDRADGDRRRLGQPRRGRPAPRQHRLRFRPAHLRLSQAERPDPQDRRFRHGPARRPHRAHPRQARSGALRQRRPDAVRTGPERGRGPPPTDDTIVMIVTESPRWATSLVAFASGAP